MNVDAPAGIARTRLLLAQCLAALLAVAVYVPALDGPFVWDDRLLLETPQIAELRPLGEYFAEPFWQVSDGSDPGSRQGAYYRPLSTLSLAVDRQLHGDTSTGFHLLGLLLHAVNTGLVLSLGRRLGATLPAAVIGSLLFAWFPRLTESVAWISGRTDVLAATFSLLALRVTLGSWAIRRWLAAGCLLVGAFCKEIALAAVVGVLCWEWLASRKARGGTTPSRRWRYLVPTGVISLIYLALRSSALGGSSQQSPISLGTRGLVSLEAASRYAIMLLDGWQPRLQIGYLAEPDPWLAALGVVLLPIPLLALRKLRTKPEQLVLLLVAFVAIGLVLHVVPIQGKVVAADRFLYLPLAMLGALAAAWISTTRAALFAATALALSYSPATWQRASVWGDDIAFWGTAVSERTARLDAHARLGFGNLLAEHGMYEEALVQYSLAEPGDAQSWMRCQYNRSGLLAMNGEFAAAISALEEARRRTPSRLQLERLATLHASQGRIDRALDLLQKYASELKDPTRARELEARITMISRLMPELARPPTTLAQALAQARGYAEVGLYRVAMAKLIILSSHPEITREHLVGMFTSAFEHGTPDQLQALEQRLRATGASYPPEYAELFAERMDRARRLRTWVQQASD